MFRTSVGTPPPSAMVRTRGGKETAPICDRCHVPVCWKAQKFLTEIRERCPDDQIRCRYCEASFSVYDLENFKQHMRTEHIECLIWYSDKVTEDREDRVGCKFCEWSVEGDENDIENLYAHLQKKHPKKLRTILGDEDLVATAFNDFGTDMIRNSDTTAHSYCEQCDQSYPYPRSGDFCLDCINNCPRCRPGISRPAAVLPVPSFADTRPSRPICSLVSLTSDILLPSLSISSTPSTPDVSLASADASTFDSTSSSIQVHHPMSTTITPASSISPSRSSPDRTYAEVVVSKLSPSAAPFSPSSPTISPTPGSNPKRRRSKNRSRSRRKRRGAKRGPVDFSPPPVIVTPPATPPARPPCAGTNNCSPTRFSSRCRNDNSTLHQSETSKSPARRTFSHNSKGAACFPSRPFPRESILSYSFSTNRRQPHQPYLWVPPAPNLEIPPIPFYIEQLQRNTGKVYTLVQGLKVSIGIIKLHTQVCQSSDYFLRSNTSCFENRRSR